MSDQSKYTPVEDIEQIRDELRKGFYSGKTKSVAFRKSQLLRMAYMIQDNMDRFREALAKDLGRPALESDMLELSGAITEAMYAYKNVEKWAKPHSGDFHMNFFAMKPMVRKEPRGVVVMITPFNYPVWLLFVPLAGAIAAGNAVLIKPSELASATQDLIAELFPKYLDSDLVRIVKGAVPQVTKILELQWDYILYTGGGRVGKIVAEAAAKHLTPVSLELGGKNPAFIDPNQDMAFTAKRILWGKTVNVGQTCVAPDYVIVERSAQDKLVEAIKEEYKKFYPDGVDKSESLSRIISDGHFNRIKTLLDETAGTIIVGGETDASTRFIAPTVVKDVKPDDSLMSQEIFGPVLAIMPVESLEDGLAFVNKHDHPLALYVFSSDAAFKSKVIDNTQSGSALVNETLMQCTAPGLPFGGVGASGYGAHTGKYSFDMFTHQRSTLDNPRWTDKLLAARYPPYTEKKRKFLAATLFPKLPARDAPAPSRFGRPFLLAVAVSAVLIFRSFGSSGGLASLADKVPGLRRLLLTFSGFASPSSH